MPIDTEHPEYTAMSEKWSRCADVMAGGDAVKAQSSEYLPTLGGQDGGEYSAYKQRALFFPITSRTVDSWRGMVFRKPVQIDNGSDRIEALLEDVTGTHTPFERFAQDAFDAQECYGRAGIYTTWPEDNPANGRAFMRLYQAQDIINWQGGRGADGHFSVTRIVLRETTQEAGEDVYTLEPVIRYRELLLEEGTFIVRLWEEQETPDEDGSKWVYTESIPTYRGEQLDRIPFELDAEIQAPPILPLVDANLHHYRLSADYAHGLHYCGLPTPWVAGFDASTELRIGSATAWVSESTDARAGMLEFTGQGLTPLSEAMAQTVDYMAALGARGVQSDRKSAEAAETHRLRQSREESSVAGVAVYLSDILTRALRTMLHFSGEEAEEVKATLNTDLVSGKLSAQELQSLIAAYQAGGMSFDTLQYNLQQGEIARPGIDAEEEKAAVEGDIAGVVMPMVEE